MAGPTPADPDAVSYALEALATGRTPRDIAAEMTNIGFPVSHETVRRWGDKARREALNKAHPIVTADSRKAASKKIMADLKERHAEPPPPPAEPEPEPGDLLASTRAMCSGLQRDAAAAKQIGNFSAAQRYMRDAGNLLILIARLEKEAHKDSDVLRISRAEVDATMAGVRARVETILARGELRCAECSRALSVRLSGARLPDEGGTE